MASSLNPRFANAGAGNFQLTEGSPAIDSADSLVSGEQAADILGNPRVDDPAVSNPTQSAGSYYDRGSVRVPGLAAARRPGRRRRCR